MQRWCRISPRGMGIHPAPILLATALLRSLPTPGSRRDLIGADEDEIVFTSCGTEADNTAIMSALETQKGRRRIVTTAVEHHAVFSLCHVLRKRGWPVDFLSVDKQGRLDLDEARAVINDETAIVSVMWANNEIGNIYPVVELAKIAHAHGALFHTTRCRRSARCRSTCGRPRLTFWP